MMILSLLLPLAALAGDISNLAECSTRGWDLSRLVRQESFQLVSRNSELGGCYARMEIVPRDAKINNGHRAELKDPRYLRAGTRTTHSFQLLIPANTRGAASRLVLAQWHDAKTGNRDVQRPPLSLRLEGNQIVFPFFNQKIWEKNPHGTGVNLAKIPAKFNVWIKIDVEANWAADSTGFVKIYVNDKLVGSHRGAVGYPTDEYSPYFKFGVYTVHPLKKAAVAYFTNYRRSIF